MNLQNPLTPLINSLANAIVDGLQQSAGNVERSYYTGKHPRQLKVKDGQYDDNLTVNYTGLATARDISRLFRGGVEWVLPKGAEKQQELIEATWDTNKQEQLLYQLGLNGSVYGTAFLKIVPDGKTNLVTGESVARLIALDPEITRVVTDPFDDDEPQEYIIEFTIDDVSYKELTRRTKQDDYVDYVEDVPVAWIIEHFILNKRSGKWEPDPNRPSMEWPYSFPPIIHWKNLPALKSDKGWHGSTDAEWALSLQDKLNFADSNINKTIRMNAAPPTIVTGVSQEPKMSTGPGSLSWFSSENTKAYNLQANADINGSRAFAGDLQSAIFQLMREVPPGVIQQLGSGLTNFVMRVIYADALDKTDTKRELYGDAFLEINRRLLVLAGYDGEASDPGMIVWGSALPINPAEQIAEDTFLLSQGLISKASVAEKYGIDYESEQETINAEKQAVNALGGNLLRDFIAGRTTGAPNV